MSLSEHFLAEKEKPMADVEDDLDTEALLIKLVCEIAGLFERKDLPNDATSARIRDLKTKLLHSAALDGVESKR